MLKMNKERFSITVNFSVVSTDTIKQSKLITGYEKLCGGSFNRPLRASKLITGFGKEARVIPTKIIFVGFRKKTLQNNKERFSVALNLRVTERGGVYDRRR